MELIPEETFDQKPKTTNFKKRRMRNQVVSKADSQPANLSTKNTHSNILSESLTRGFDNNCTEETKDERQDTVD